MDITSSVSFSLPGPPPAAACRGTRRKLAKRLGRFNFIAWGLWNSKSDLSQSSWAAEGAWLFLMLQTSLQLSLVPWTQPCPGLLQRAGAPGITRAVQVHVASLGSGHGPLPAGRLLGECRNTFARSKLCLLSVSRARAKCVIPV